MISPREEMLEQRFAVTRTQAVNLVVGHGNSLIDRVSILYARRYSEGQTGLLTNALQSKPAVPCGLRRAGLSTQLSPADAPSASSSLRLGPSGNDHFLKKT